MSGVKKATVTQNLKRTMSAVREALQQCASLAEATGQVGKGEFAAKRRNAQTVHQNVVRKLPEDVAAFLRGETAQWEFLLKRHDESFEKAGVAESEADRYESAFRQHYASAEDQLNDISRAANRLKNRISGKAGYLDSENYEALELGHRAREIAAALKPDVAMTRNAQQSRREAFNKFAESENLAQAAQREYDRLVNLAHDRQEQKRIAEENERNAKMLDADLKSLRKEIESKNYKKFANGRYTDGLRRELDALRDLVVGCAYDEAIPRAQRLKDTLVSISAEIDANEQVWTAAKTAAERALADAKAEMALANRSDVELYSGLSKAVVDAIYAKIEGAARLIESESFDVASSQIADTLGKLRSAVEKSIENKNLASQREEIAQSIMQALYDCDYDTPSYYQKDEGDELSDLCVVAAAPGGVGDMRLRIALDGNVSFEVENIPEGHEKLCVESVRRMQEKLAEDDIRFHVTDWGRAENQNKVHLDVQPKARQTQMVRQRQG